MGVLLSAPVTHKETTTGRNDSLIFATSAMQGWRVTMEDAHCSDLDIASDVSFFAIFDGHGGEEVAIYCSNHIVDYIKKNDAFLKGDYPKSLVDAYLVMDEQLASDEGRVVLGSYSRTSKYTIGSISADHIGCTAVSCLYNAKNKKLYVANAGDSRIVLCKGGEAIALSVDHKPSLDTEIRRIEAAGGYIVAGRVNGNLNLCRSIGDQEYKKNTDLEPKDQIISAHPETYTCDITPDCEFVCLGCDGIWDVLSNQECVDIVRQKLGEVTRDDDLSSIVEFVLDRCCAKDRKEIIGCDNISFTIVVFTENARWATNKEATEPSNNEMKLDEKSDENDMNI